MICYWCRGHFLLSQRHQLTIFAIIIEWMNEYHRRRPDAAALQIKVDDYMEKFERSEYEAQQAALARHNVMDEDGFTLVTRAGSKGQNSDGVISITAAKAEDVKDLKPKKKELQDFYRFQMREAKRDSKSYFRMQRAQYFCLYS